MKEVCADCKPYFDVILARLESLEKKNMELERRLALYENAHTPSSKQRFPKKKEKKGSGKFGAPKGHKGNTRSVKDPDEIIPVNLSLCPHCTCKLGKPVKIEKRIIEEIPEPQPVKVIQYNLAHYWCNNCLNHVVAQHDDLPSEGRLGKNVLSHIALMKFEDRLPIRKVVNTLKRSHNLQLTHTTILDVTRRVSARLRGTYKQIIQKIRDSNYVHIDQTDMKVDGITHYLWVFVTKEATLFIIRKAKMNSVMEEILGKDYQGIIVGDGISTYRTYTDRIQRCWAHLLREAETLAEKHEGTAREAHKELKEIFAQVKTVTYEDPPDQRQKLYDKCISQTKYLVQRLNAYTELKKLGKTIHNGLTHWYTCILHPHIPPTNNTAERALREPIIQRKIMGTLRNTEGTKATETILTALTTWQQNGLNTFSQLRVQL